MGHPVLRKRTVLVQPDEIDTPSMQRLIDDMFDTMNEYVGIGLAAPQVHQERRLFVAGVDDPNSTMQPVVMINPEIEVIDDEKEEEQELEQEKKAAAEELSREQKRLADLKEWYPGARRSCARGSTRRAQRRGWCWRSGTTRRS